MSSSIGNGKVALLHYTLTGPDGRVIDASRRGSDPRTGSAGATGEPLAYLHGHGNIVPGLEKALEGKGPGDKVHVVVPPAEAYGERKGKGAQAVPRREFPKNVELREGLPLEIRGTDGMPVRVWVTKVQGARVWIDIDHPLAGKELTFDVEVVAVRDALPEELEHGHAHGAHGHGQHG